MHSDPLSRRDRPATPFQGASSGSSWTPFQNPHGANGIRHSKVIKTLWPPTAGTLRHRERFGSDVVCVRYREDRVGLRRFTTVELLIDVRRAPKAAKRQMHRWWFPFQRSASDPALMRLLRAHGARTFMPEPMLYLKGSTIAELGLEDQIAAAPPRRIGDHSPELPDGFA